MAYTKAFVKIEEEGFRVISIHLSIALIVISNHAISEWNRDESKIDF
jgi:hypothetical protein